MTIPFKSIYLTYIFFSLISSFAISSTAINYLLFAFILCIWIIFLIVGIKSRVSFIWIDFIPMIFILTWAYGVFLGFLFGNNITFIISNFAGMTIFSIYYIILFSQITAKDLIKIVFAAAIVNALYSYGQTFWLIFIDGRSYFSLVRTYYSPGLSVLGPFLASSLVYITMVSSKKRGNNKFNQIALFLFLFIPYIVLSFSKGYFASLVFLVTLIAGVLFISSIQHFKIKKWGLIYVITLFICFVAIAYNFSTEILYLYSNQETGNSFRSEQAPMIMEEFTIIGNGLGAVLDSGYYRNEGQPYGFELTFLAILHKFGVLGYLLWACYAVCILIPLKHIFYYRSCIYSWLAIGGMLFIVPGYGNPLLFHPTIVILHCIVFFWIRTSIIKYRERKYV